MLPNKLKKKFHVMMPNLKMSQLNNYVLVELIVRTGSASTCKFRSDLKLPKAKKMSEFLACLQMENRHEKW